MRTTHFAATLALATALPAIAFASERTPEKPIVVAVNEGVSYRVTQTEQREKYAPLIADLEKALGKKVTFVSVDRYDALAAGLKDGEYGLAYVHPTHIASAAVREQRYRLIAVSAAHQNYRAAFLINQGPEVRSSKELWQRYLGDAKWMNGKPIGAPDETSITAVIARATIRDAAQSAGININQADLPKFKFSRYQDSIPSMIEYGFSNVAVTASKPIIDHWVSAKKSVAFMAPGVPIKLWIASKDLPDTDTARIRDYLIGLKDSKSGLDKLRQMSLPQGFVSYEEAALMKIDQWLRDR